MKKIATVSVLAIMAVSAARADIASTTYVDKTAASAVTTGLSETGNITAAIKTATTDMATQTKVAQDIATAVTDMATKNWVTTEATAAKAMADSEGKVIKDTYATIDDLDKVAGGELKIKEGAVGTTELANGSVTEVKLNEAVINKYVDTDELNTALQPYANNTANYQNADQVSAAISTATTATGGAVKTAIENALADYSTTEQMNTALADKQDTTTAVTHTANTAVGDETHAVYIDSTGAAKVVDKVASAAAADTASDYASTGGIKTKFDGVDASLAKVSALGNVPVPDKCKTDAFDCTLVVKYDQVAGAAVPQWEAIAR